MAEQSSGGDSNKPNLSKSCKGQEMAESHDHQRLEVVWHTEEQEEEEVINL